MGKKLLLIELCTALLLLCGACSKHVAVKTDAVLKNEKVSAGPDIDGRIFKTVGGRDIEAHIFYPENYDPNREELYVGGVSFGGGAWVEGGIEYSYDGARVMAENGMVGVAIDYRRADYEENSSLDAIKDATSGVRWLRIHAEELHINPDRVMAFGISAGAHLAICTAMFPQLMEPTEDPEISSVPDVVVGVCPPVAVNEDPYFQKLLLGQEKAVNCSPIDNVRSGLVPMYFIQGTADETVSYDLTKEFTEDMRKAGNSVELYPFEGGGHDFFYRDPEGVKFWKKTFANIVDNSLGWN